MRADALLSAYRRALRNVGKERTVKVRRYSGTGTTRSSADTIIKARVLATRVSGTHDEPLVGALQEGSQQVIALAQDLIDAGFVLPLRSSDKIVIDDKEHTITGLDDTTRALGDTLIAYDLVVKG